MAEILGFLLGLVLMLIYFALIIAGLCIVLGICAVALMCGAVSGVGFGIIMGIKNYFAALFTQVRLRQ